MSQIDFNMNIPKIQNEAGKGLNKAVQKEQVTALFDLRPVLSEGEKKPDAASREAFDVMLKQYDGNGDMMVSGGNAMFPEHLQASLGTIFADLKHLGLIASYALDMNGWSLVLTANGLALFNLGEKTLKKGTALTRRLPSNTLKLLLAIVDSDDPAAMLQDRFEKSGYDEDKALLGMIRELVSEGYIRVPIWKDDVPQYVEIDDSVRAYEEPGDNYQAVTVSLSKFSIAQEEKDAVQEVSHMTLGATVYVSNSLEAVPLYMEAFGLTLGYHAKNEDGTFWHAELERDGAVIFAVSESRNEALAKLILQLPPEAHPTIGIGMNFETEAEVKKAYDMLKSGGKVLYPMAAVPWSTCSAEVIDKYGVNWCIYVTGKKDG